MKRILSLVCLFLALLTLCGCVSQQDFDKLSNEKSKIESENAEIKKELDNTKAQLDKTNKELDDLKNGASYRLSEIKSAYEAKNYDRVLSLAAELHSKFNGVSEDVEGQKFAKQAQTAIDAAAAEAKATADKAAAEAAKTAQEKARSIIHITKLSKSSPNSAGGVDLFIGFKNTCDKTIKYVTFTVVPYNAVGDQVTCDVRNESDYNARATGPFKKGEGFAGNYNNYWDCAWYNWQIKSLKMTQIYIEYTDGTVDAITGDDIGYVIY